jgi:hypothetical protein
LFPISGFAIANRKRLVCDMDKATIMPYSPISLPRKTVRDDMGASKANKYWSVQAIPSNTFVTTALTEHEEQHRQAETANA